jgi:hypothetical protein
MIHDIRSQQPQGSTNGKSEIVLATIPQGGGDTELEVVLIYEASSGAMRVELRSLVWGDGVGWYRQHTLQLDGTAARHLIQALGIVQRRVERQSPDTLGPKVLPFPRSHPADATTAEQMPLGPDLPNIAELEMAMK